MKKEKMSFRSFLILIYIAFIWGSTFIVTKNSLELNSPMLIVSSRFFIAALILFIVLLVRKQNPFEDIKEGITLGVFMSLIYLPQTIGLKYTTISNSAFISAMYVLFVPFIGFIVLKHKFSKTKIFAGMISLAGTFVLTGSFNSFNIGDIITVAAAFGFAMHIIFSEKFVRSNIHPVSLSFQQFFTVFICSFIMMLFNNEKIELKAVLNDNFFISILYLALFPTLTAFVAQLYVQRKTCSSKVSCLLALEPIFAMMIAYIIGKEQIKLNVMIGGFLIVASVFLYEIQEFFKRKI